MTRHVQLLWFEGCPNYLRARQMVDEVVARLGVAATVEMIDIEDEETGNRYGFPGSPTIRVDGIDIDPGFEPCADCTPRCRVYFVDGHLTGLPARQWLEGALDPTCADRDGTRDSP